jgi:trigger factor
VHCEVPFPEDYSSKVIAGKTAQFTIAVSEIKRKQLPEINDEFATMAGAESLAALRETFAKQLTERFEATSRRIAETNAMKAIVEASTFELPKTLVEASAKEYYEQEVRRLSELRVPQSDIRARDEEIRAEAEANAIREIKGFVALNEIGSAEGIEVTEADFEKEAESIIARTGAASEAVGRFLQDEAHRDEYEGRIYRRKAMDLILGNAQITDKEVTEDELDKENAEV